MPKDIYELYNVWEGNTEDFSKEVTTLDKTGRRLVLFAPNEYPWADMGIDLSSTIRYDLSYGVFVSRYLNSELIS